MEYDVCLADIIMSHYHLNFGNSCHFAMNRMASIDIKSSDFKTELLVGGYFQDVNLWWYYLPLFYPATP